MAKTISGIDYNWFFSTSENATGFDSYFIGSAYGGLKCVKIDEHSAECEGDKWFYDVYFDNDTMVRIFNPNQVFYLAK